MRACAKKSRDTGILWKELNLARDLPQGGPYSWAICPADMRAGRYGWRSQQSTSTVERHVPLPSKKFADIDELRFVTFYAQACIYSVCDWLRSHNSSQPDGWSMKNPRCDQAAAGKPTSHPNWTKDKRTFRQVEEVQGETSIALDLVNGQELSADGASSRHGSQPSAFAQDRGLQAQWLVGRRHGSARITR